MKKRFLAAVMAAVVTLGALTGCGSSSESASAGTSSSGQRTVEDIKAAGKLKVGAKSDTVNIGMINTATGEYEGYDIDVAYEMAAKIFGCTYDEAVANKLCEFTSVTAKTRAKTLADMDGFVIGVGQGTTTAELIEQYAKDKGIDVNYEVQDFQYISDGVAALKTGQIDAYSVDRTGLIAYMDDSMMLTEDAFGVQDIGIALKLGNDELTKFMDDTLTELKESGRLDELKAKWGILTDEEVAAMQ